MTNIASYSNPATHSYTYQTKDPSLAVDRNNISTTAKTREVSVSYDTVDISPDGKNAYESIVRFKGTVTQNGEVISEYEGENFAFWDDHKGWIIVEKCTLNEGQETDDVNYSHDNIGIFVGSSNPYANLSKMLGLVGSHTDKTSLLSSLDKLISEESEGLSKILGTLLNEAGLGSETKKITFAEDAEGNIVIEGNISAKKKKQLAQLVNNDPELVERIKTQKARTEIADELRKDEPDLSGEQFNVARTQLLKDFLEKNGINLDDIRLEDHESGFKNFVQRDAQGNVKSADTLSGILNEYPDLGWEIKAHLERKETPQASPLEVPAQQITLANKQDLPDEEESTAVRSLLSMKRGVLSEASDAEPDLDSQVDSLRSMVSKEIVGKVNEMFGSDEDAKIADFTMKIDDKGNLRISDVRTKQ